MLSSTDADAAEVTVFAEALFRIKLLNTSIDVDISIAEMTVISEALFSIKMTEADVDVDTDTAEVTVIAEALFRIELIISAETKCIKIINKLS